MYMFYVILSNLFVLKTFSLEIFPHMETSPVKNNEDKMCLLNTVAHVQCMAAYGEG